MQRGKKKAVKKIISYAFKKIKIEQRKNGLKILFLALIKNRPLLWFAPIRLGREIKQIPVPISARRQLVISLSWFVIALKLLRAESKIVNLQDVFYNQLKAVLYKEKTILTQRRMDHIQDLVENRVNLHHRWK
jgi:ribosomal protein S7